MLSRFVVWQ
jgi:hypothetical protein